MRPSSRRAAGCSGATRSIVDAMLEPCAARAGHPGALVSAGSKSQTKTIDPDDADRGAGDPVTALDHARRRQPGLQQRTDREPERLAEQAEPDHERQDRDEPAVRGRGRRAWS